MPRIFAGGGAAEGRQIVKVKVDVVGDHEIDEAIAVVVAESGAGGPAAVGDSGFCGHVGEGAVAVVAIENIPAEAGDVDVGPAIVVVVAHGAAHREARRGNAQPCRLHP